VCHHAHPARSPKKRFAIHLTSPSIDHAENEFSNTVSSANQKLRRNADTSICAFPNTTTLMTTLRYMANTKIAIANILASPSPAIHLPEFQFTGTTGAANHNWSILERYNLDLHQVLLSQVFGSTLRTFGSEFRSIDLLRSFIQDHPLWPRFCCWLAHGVQFPLQPLPKIQHTQDLALMVARANHA